MQNIGYRKSSFNTKTNRIYTKRHNEIIDALEVLLESGVPNLTMSEIAKKLKISLRTLYEICLLYTSPSPRDRTRSRMPSSA